MENMENKQFDKIETVDLQVEMARSYLDYAMSVIVGRALPDVRDVRSLLAGTAVRLARTGAASARCEAFARSR